jgi:predicted unusual protein kinase regulating ubiquinone biosynthesis (AarF/ABC1/UbiB family)
MSEREGRRPAHVPVGRVRRAAPLVGLAGRTAGEAVVTSLRRRIRGDDGEDFHLRAAERYAQMLGRSKGVLMKAGQILSFVTVGPAVPDQYRTIYQATLARLQDSAPPMPARLAASIIERELGADTTEIFAEFDPQPLAAASIGQVHAARLPDGRRVAVKIQYPGVEEAIRADLRNTELLATFFSLVRTLTPDLTRADARALAREVAERIGEEIDYRIEARNQAAFADAYRDHPFIHIPEPIGELSTRRVLTMDLVEGLRWPDALTADAELRNRWGEAIFRFALGSLRRLRMFNADPHPGNYLFHQDGKVTFLDFGCVKHFAPEHVATMRAIVAAAVNGDAHALLLLLDGAGFIDPGNPPEPGDLLAWFREQFQPLIAPQPFTYTPQYAAAVVHSEFSPFGRYSAVTRRLSLQPNYLMITRIDLGVTAVLAELRATGNWAAIRAEWDCDAPAGTPLGRLDLAFWAEKT